MGLMDILNGMQNGSQNQSETGKGSMSPMTVAMLALMAFKAYNKFTSQPDNAQSPHMAPSASADGSLGGLLGGLLGGSGSGGIGNLIPGGLSSLVAGGAAGGAVSGGLDNLLKELTAAGHGEIARSWVGTGANKDISPQDLGSALGDDKVNALAEQAGLSKLELLNGLSQNLPQLVDQLTPQGRVPSEREMSQML